MIPELGGGLGLGGPQGKGSPSVSKGVKTKCLKPLIQLLQLLKKRPREVKGPIFIYWVPPGPTQEMELMGPGGEGPSRSPPPPPVSLAMTRDDKTTDHEKNHTRRYGW